MQGGTGQLKHLLFRGLFACLGLSLPAWAEPTLTLRNNITWVQPERWFGGLSGLEVSADGLTLTLISDRGGLITADLIRSEGEIERFAHVEHRTLRHPDGHPFAGNDVDAEGLAISASGAAFVSFEARHRVMSLNPTTGETQDLSSHPDFKELPFNAGLEALALHPDGRLFALPESRRNGTQTVSLYVQTQNGWQQTQQIPASGGFVPVGADFDLQGRLYVLERTVSPLGFRSRIRRFDLTQSPPADTTLLTSHPGQFENLEGLSVWQDAMGQTRLTMISDDNFWPVLSTQIVEYTLNE